MSRRCTSLLTALGKSVAVFALLFCPGDLALHYLDTTSGATHILLSGIVQTSLSILALVVTFLLVPIERLAKEDDSDSSHPIPASPAQSR